MSNDGTVAPGWYHAAGDPPGTERWWDGTTWVGGPQATSAPPTGYGPPPGYGATGYGPPPGYGTAPFAYAGWWRRVGAWLLDGLIIGIPSAIVLGIFEVLLPHERGLCEDFDGDLYVCDTLTSGASAVLALVRLAAGLLIAYFYFARLEGTSGQTLGKRATGIRVVRTHTLAPIGVSRAFGRYFARILSALPCLLGLLWPLWDAQKQTFHDKICDTVVIRYG